MSTLGKTVLVEAKLFLREPLSGIFGVLFPSALLLILGAVPVLREPSAEFDGARFVELWAPTALVLGLSILGLQQVPNALAGYRHNGVLRRMSTTPVHPAQLLAAQLVVALAAAVAAAGLLVLTAWLVLDVPPPAHPARFTLAFLVGFAALLSLGLLIAAVAPTIRAANGLAVAVFMLVMFAGGVYLPRFLMPEVLVRVGDFTPPGVQALLETWLGGTAAAAATGAEAGGGPYLAQLGIMALVAVAAGAVAARLFRWE